MPLVDMPLEELRRYTGINPCPSDMDEYWEQALKEMRAVDPCLELMDAAFQWDGVRCRDLWYSGVRGGRIHAKLLMPAQSSGPVPALLRFHGYHQHTQDWSRYLFWALSGFVVAAMDVRGQGGPSSDGASYRGSTIKGQIIRGLDDDIHNMAFRHIFLDAARLADLLMNMEEVDETRVGCYGNSQGGGLSLACAALEPRIRRVVSLHPFLSDYKRVWMMDLNIQAYEEINYFFRMFDPEHAREDEIFRRLGYIDIKNLTDRIRGKVLMGIGLMDTICPPSTVFAAYNRIVSEKQIRVYPDYNHEEIPAFTDETSRFFQELIYV